MSSPHNATGYYTVYGEEALHADHFSTKLSFGDTQTVWARTGYLGFLRRTELTDASGGESRLVFENFFLRDMDLDFFQAIKDIFYILPTFALT